jgi:hypothetical protein
LQALGFRYGEIAAATGDTLRTVERQMTRARKAVLEAGVDPDARLTASPKTAVRLAVSRRQYGVGTGRMKRTSQTLPSLVARRRNQAVLLAVSLGVTALLLRSGSVVSGVGQRRRRPPVTAKQ